MCTIITGNPSHRDLSHGHGVSTTHSCLVILQLHIEKHAGVFSTRCSSPLDPLATEAGPASWRTGGAGAETNQAPLTRSARSASGIQTAPITGSARAT